MTFFLLSEICCIRNLKKRFEKIEGGGKATLISPEPTDDQLMETKMREDALRGIMEAINNHPDVFDEEHNLDGPDKSQVKLLSWAQYDDPMKETTENMLGKALDDWDNDMNRGISRNRRRDPLKDQT